MASFGKDRDFQATGLEARHGGADPGLTAVTQTLGESGGDSGVTGLEVANSSSRDGDPWEAWQEESYTLQQ